MSSDCHEPTCDYLEPHSHGFACDETCKQCHGHTDEGGSDA